MLDNLPPELLAQILGHLPSASSIVNVDRVNQRLHASISASQYAIFREFVQGSFPSIATPPLWRDMARQLTSRSRAWDRRSFIARECHPTGVKALAAGQTTQPAKFGFTPVIDSYEEHTGNLHDSKRTVLAFGAAGRLRLRISEKSEVAWSSFCIPDDHLALNDVVDLRLLKPEEHPRMDGETLIVRRANKSIIKLRSGTTPDNFTQVSQYITGTSGVDCMDISTGLDAQLAVFDKTSLQLFALHSDAAETRPTVSMPVVPTFTWQNRKKCAKFLTNDTIATSVQFVQGSQKAPILIYDVTPSNLVSRPLQSSMSIASSDDSAPGRRSANVLAKLDAIGSTAGRPGEVFLSGWTDACIHLHDLRTPYEPVSTYWDPVDNGKILSLATYGHEKFFAGSHQNGCLKMFDMRMPGARPYSYFDTGTGQNNSHAPTDQVNSMQNNTSTSSTIRPASNSRRDMNIFLCPIVNTRGRLWEPLPPQDAINEIVHIPFIPGRRGSRDQRSNLRHQRGPQQQNNSANTYTRYRGSVYSLSTPSPSSATLFAGIENHIIQLDFINTDDIRRRTVDIPPITTSEIESNTSTPQSDNILNLSCYERPRRGFEATDPVLLRKQLPWSAVMGATAKDGGESHGDHELEDHPELGWDERWRLGKSWKGRGRGSGS